MPITNHYTHYTAYKKMNTNCVTASNQISQQYSLDCKLHCSYCYALI